jgi:hypothetical protein
MSSPVKLATPYPTIEEAAQVYGISSNRLERLKKMVQSLLQRSPNKPASVPSAASRSARKTKGSGTQLRVKKSSQHAHTKKRTAPTK